MIRFLPKVDLLLILPALILSALGLLMIYSTSFESDHSFFARQIFYLLFSVIAFVVISKVNFKNILQLSPFLYVFLIILLVGTFILGVETRGSVRWIDLGVVNLQASELAKPIMVLVLAFFFTRYPPTNLRNFFFSGVLALLPFLLIFRQPDLGNSFIIIALWLFMVFVAGVNMFYLAASLFGLLSILPIIWSLLKDYQKTRILTFLNPNLDPQGTSYNVVQALIALGSGQLMGKGFGRGTQSHLNFLPEGSTDFIFASLGEELGFIGISLVIVVFAFLIYYLLRRASLAKTKSASLFIFGSAFILFFQFFINAGMNMGIVPVTGITLPFVSFGGSSILSFFILLGLAQKAEEE